MNDQVEVKSNLLSSPIMLRYNKLECLILAMLFWYRTILHYGRILPYSPILYLAKHCWRGQELAFAAAFMPKGKRLIALIRF
jgi:hypothetical protein